MYKVINIEGEDYKLEYSIEASLYGDCITAVTDMMTGISYADSQSDNPVEGIKEFLKTIADIPQTAMTIFYAGLLEHHGAHPDGDGKVPDMRTAKHLVRQYMFEQKGTGGNSSFYDVLTMCLEQMGEDGFFELTGLEKMLTDMGTANTEKAPKAPQDHKRKATAKQS